MQKTGLIVVISGSLIVLGLVLMVLGNQFILEGVSQGNDILDLGNTLTISADFDSQDTSKGVFAVQITNFKDNTLSAKVFDPFNVEIISQLIDEESIEREFEVVNSGTYKLILESASNEETQVFAAIGPLPDAGKKVLGFISVYVLIFGMIGLVIGAIFGIKKKRSV